MARVITFSKYFPCYHPKAGKPTGFVMKIWKSLGYTHNYELIKDLFTGFHDKNVMPKHHTLRGGSRWKVGDKFSPRIWSGEPYRSKQIAIAHDCEVIKVWAFKMYSTDKHCH